MKATLDLFVGVIISAVTYAVAAQLGVRTAVRRDAALGLRGIEPGRVPRDEAIRSWPRPGFAWRLRQTVGGLGLAAAAILVLAVAGSLISGPS